MCPYNWRRLWGELALVKFTTVMASSGPQQTSLPHAESGNVNQQGELHDFEPENHVDNQQEGSSQTIHADRSGYRRRGHLVQEHADEKDLQREIKDLKKKLRRAQRNQTPSSSDVSSNDEGEDSYREFSETPPVNPILMKRNTLTRGGEKVRLEREWELKL